LTTPSAHILIAEDEPHTRFTLSLVLRKSGYNVTTADDGRTALKIIEERLHTPYSINLLITDIQMAGLNGVDLISELEKVEIVLPVLVITGYGHEEKVLELKQKENISIIDKPFAPADLIRGIRQIFSGNT
jgi:DNA-binding NtrC family response regulator